jgi:nuclear transport factor 2 (NTF2) superfamily protein
METKPPLPPFTAETAAQKVRLAEDAWNTRDPDRVVLVYSADTQWRNRTEFPIGRDQVRQLLVRKWAKELDYRLIKELWRIRAIASRCDLRMSGTMTRDIGFAPMATKTGNSTTTGS